MLRSLHTCRLQRAYHHAPLSLQDLVTWNKILRERAPGGGITRGAHLKMEMRVVASRGFLFAFPPADQVSRRLSDWLRRAKRLTSQDTSPTQELSQIVELYREFEIIHPFSDGNERTGRMAVNHLLVGSGLRPLRRPVHIQQILFVPHQIAVESVICALQN